MSLFGRPRRGALLFWCVSLQRFCGRRAAHAITDAASGVQASVLHASARAQPISTLAVIADRLRIAGARALQFCCREGYVCYCRLPVLQIYAVRRRRTLSTKRDVTDKPRLPSMTWSSATAEVSPHASFMSLLPLHRVSGRPVGTWPQTPPSALHGPMAARSHNYAANMRISLPMTAKQGLETHWERHKTRFSSAARLAKIAAIRTPYALGNTFVR
jgi:hypothetical protein